VIELRGLTKRFGPTIVAAHDGRVELRTAPDEGTAFRLILPALTDGRAR
jgi:signal transduction histidine kinase